MCHERVPVKARTVLALAGMAFSTATMPAQLPNHTIDGGGGASRELRFGVAGSIAQFDADPTQPSISASGRFEVRGGFWSSRPTASQEAIFADGFE